MSAQELLGSTLESKTFSFDLTNAPSQKATTRQTYIIVLEQGEDGWIVVKCLDLPGVVTQGKTENEAIKNAMDAIRLMLEELGIDKEFNVIVLRTT